MCRRSPSGLPRFVLAGCAALATSTALAETPVLELRDCVQTVVPGSKTLINNSPIGDVADLGNVTVMEITGDYTRGLDEPRRQAAQRFYENHVDAYDFLVVFTTFEFDTGSALAFYNGIRNDTVGLGQPRFDLGVDFGSTSRLQGYIDMAAMSRYAFSLGSADYHNSIDTLAHEVMHRWGTQVLFTDATGHDSADLLGRDAMHWSYFLDTDASVMYGNDWQAQPDGSFRSVDVRHRYSPLDMYLAGFAAPDEVPPFTLIRGAANGNAADLPLLGALTTGSTETITIDQIISASGARVPAAANAQKDFSAALILLKRPGESIPADRLLDLERFRLRFQQQLGEMTDGRASIRIYTQTRGAGVSPPAVLHGSGTTSTPGGVSSAVAWLESHQEPDGHWQDRPGTAMRDTAAVVRALEELDPAYAGLAAAHGWMAGQPISNLDQHGWKLVGARLDSDSAALAATQDAHGGFALEPGWNASGLDTALVATALANHGRDTRGVGAALQVIGSLQNSDGSFGIADGGRGHLLPTLRVANLLSQQADGGSAQRLLRATEWIRTRVAANGGIGTSSESSLASTVDTYGLLGRLALEPAVNASVRNFVRQNQQVEGDWGGSIYLTATAALAYAHDQRPNLALATTPTVLPTPLLDGEQAALGVVVANTGNVPVAATTLRWYDGDPDLGGTQIGNDAVVPELAAASRSSITQHWDTNGRAGTHDLYVVLDATSIVAEASELDNRAHVAATVLPPSTAPDLALTASDFSLDPTSVSSLPHAVTLHGSLHNIGSQNVSGCMVRLFARPDLGHALAEAVVNVPARGDAPIDMAFTVVNAATLDLLLRADPDGVIAEASEVNNDAAFTLPFDESLDLEVQSADLALVTSQPLMVGRDIEFDAWLHNRGTTDSPPVTLHADIVQNGIASPVFDGPMQITAGQSVHRHLFWQALQPGLARLHVALDPAQLVPEADEGNNTATLDLEVGAPTEADLSFVGGSLVFAPSPALEGKTLTASLGIRNLSSIATGAFRVALYASDPRNGATSIGTTLVASLAGSSQASISIEVPELSLRGDQHLFAWIDSDDQIVESDESNNTIVGPLRVLPLPDVAISVADMTLSPTLPAPGQAVQARITVRNLGGQDAQGLVVRLLEGGATDGAPVGSDIDVGTLPAGASTTLVWNWTLGLAASARSITAIADPDDVVREGNADNNIASLPYDVQDTDFFSSERYISPNGDGVQDAAIVVFRLQQPGPVEIDVINGVQHAVRHFTGVALNSDFRGQVLWDGRDDRGRIVPDGDYHVVAINSIDQGYGSALITVDNDASSLLEAVGTRHGIDGMLLGNPMKMAAPPITSPLRDDVFAIWQQDGHPAALVRSDMLFTRTEPVISYLWLAEFARTHGPVELAEFAFSPSGDEIAVVLRNGMLAWVLQTGVSQTDAPRLLATLHDLVYPHVLGYFDATTLVVGPSSIGQLQLIDTRSGSMTPMRGLDELSECQHLEVLPLGVLCSDGYGDALAFLPRDEAKPPMRFASAAWDDAYRYRARLSPQKRFVAVHERNRFGDTVDIVDLESGARRTLQRTTDWIEQSQSAGRYGIGWMDRRDQLLIVDGVTHALSIYSESGLRQAEWPLPVALRVGDYVAGDQTAPDFVTPHLAYPEVPADLVASCNADIESEATTGQRIFDPATNRLLLSLGETVGIFRFSEGSWYRIFEPGIEDYYGIDPDDGEVDALREGTLVPLIEPADQATHPLRVHCQDELPDDWPRLILKDGARVRMDGRAQTLTRGVSSSPWLPADRFISLLWPDESRALTSDAHTFASVSNLTAILRARTLGRGIELSGVAADRNFASYRLDWAPIEHPADWHVLTSASSEEVILDEFLTWVPPQPGTFVLRLTVVDKAGNSTSSTAVASSFDVAVIDNFALTPRYLSPNGDGAQDAALVKYRVRQPTTLQIRVTDANGATVRSVDRTYGSNMLAPDEFVWDGRGDSGQSLPDGRYRISLGGFAAWVTIDTVPPQMTGSIGQPYRGVDGLVAILASLRYDASDAHLAETALESSPVGADSWKVFDGPRYGDAPVPSLFADHVFRARATDLAGNATSLALGGPDEVLLLENAALTPDVGGYDSSLRFNHQPPPFGQVPDMASWRSVAVDPSGYYLHGWDYSGRIVSVAVEAADVSTPQQWVEHGNFSLIDMCGASPCLHNVLGQLFIPLDLADVPLGSRALVRLRGERADGTRIYSNQGLVIVGGIDAPGCFGIAGADGLVSASAQEYFDGPLARATLQLASGGEIPASQINDHGVQFARVPNDASARVIAIDATGVARRSPTGVIHCDPIDPPGGDGTSWTIGFAPVPVVSDRCDGQPSGRVGLRVAMRSADPSAPDNVPKPSHVRVVQMDGSTGTETVLLDEAVTGPLSRNFELATASWPAGEYDARLVLGYPDGSTITRTARVPVVKSAPHVEIESPRDGERVCVVPDAVDPTLQHLPFTASISSPTPSGFRMSMGLGAHPTDHRCFMSRGEDPATDCAKSNVTGHAYESLVGFDGESLIGSQQEIVGAMSAHDGLATLQMKGLNWSGGTVCAEKQIYVDSSTAFEERGPPQSYLPLNLNGVSVLAVAPTAATAYATARLSFHAFEPVHVAVRLHRAQAVAGKLVVDDQPVATLLQSDSVQDDFDFAWNGSLDGDAAVDGLYALVVEVGDECGHVASFRYGVLVDSTPPVVTITSPSPASTIDAAVFEIGGSVADAVHVSSWSLDYSMADSPGAWFGLASGQQDVPSPATLASWARGSLIGPVDLRLSATDAVGNRSETHLPLVLGAPNHLIGSAQVQPPLFSPNADGVLDSARVQLVLLQAASVDARVVDSNDVPVASLLVGTQAAGTSSFSWAGTGRQGSAVPDGNYRIHIAAENGVDSTETVDLSVLVDTVAPAVQITQPAGDFISSSSIVSAHFSDEHFSTWGARLVRLADNTVVASQSGTQAGDAVIASLSGYTDGHYALHVEARDAAGNATVRDSEFELDAVAPVVTLEVPADGSLIASATTVSVTGSVDDAHLASYLLEVAPENTDTWTELRRGTDNVPLGELLAWHPNLPDGHYRLRLRATDEAGNAAEIVHAIEIDGTPPVALISAPVDGGYLRASSSIQGTATDAHFAGYRLSVILAAQVDGGQWSDVYTGTSPVDVGQLATLNLNLPEGDYLLRLTVTDRAGLVSDAQVHVRIDSQAPPSPPGLSGHVDNNRDAVLDWTAVQASDLDGYWVYRGGERITAAPVAGAHYIDADAPEGNLPYQVRAVDTAGNESVPSNTVVLLVDHTPPVAQIARPVADERVHGNYEVVGTAYSGDDFKQYRVSAQVLNRPVEPVVLATSTLSAQGHPLATWNTAAPQFQEEDRVRLRLDAEDVRGNIATATVDVVVDNAPPAAPTGLAAVLAGGDAQLHWDPNSEADLLGYLLYRDNQLVNAIGPTLPSDLRPFALADVQYIDALVPDGQHSYVLYAIDRAGNVSPPSAPASLDPLDNTPPSMVIETPANGTQFESSVTVLATSRDTDIAEVRFGYRALGTTDWIELGTPLGAAPYRVTWTPTAGLSYGSYEIRAVARDIGGRYDQAPPVVVVVYADLTAPPAPTNLSAHADGGTVHLAWTASDATDLVGYRLYRDGAPQPDLSPTMVTFDDGPLDDGHHDYTVVALDSMGNESPPSNVAAVEVFGVLMEQPFTPTAQASIDLSGRSTRAGGIALHVETELGQSDSVAGSTSANGTIVLAGQMLANGSNRFTLRVTDASGNISRPAELWIDRGAIPATPAGLSANVVDHQVVLDWNANAEADLLGYRVFRNDQAVNADRLLGEALVASSDDSSAAAAVDGDPRTAWEASVYDGAGESASDPALELAWVEPRIVVGANVTWAALDVANGRFDIEAWSGHAWVRVARVRDAPQAASTIAFTHPYRTTRIRLIMRSANTNTAAYNAFALAELQLSERPVQGARSLSDTVIDGIWRYQVSAISAYAFESALSGAIDAGVGDTQGPDAVVLSGDLSDNTATLVWTASNANDIGRYELQRDGQAIASVDAGALLSYVDGGLPLGAHTYVVRAYDGFGNEGPPSNAVVLTVVGEGPGVPVNLIVTAPAEGGALDIGWQAGGGAAVDHYVLRRGPSAGGPFETIGDHLSDTSYRDAPLQNGTAYHYTVEAVDAAGNASGPGAPVSGTPRDRVAPQTPMLTFPTVAGEPISRDAASTDVCGVAEPGASIDLGRGDTFVTSIAANDIYAMRRVQIVDYGTTPLPSPSGGRIASVDSSGVIRVSGFDDAVGTYSSPAGTRLASWASRGALLYYGIEGSDQFYRWEPGLAPEPFTPSSISLILAFAANTRGSGFAAAGSNIASDGTPVDGVWLFDAIGGQPKRIDAIQSSTLSARRPLRWSPDDAHLLVIENAGSMHLVDAHDATVVTTLPIADTAAAWSPDGRWIAYARDNGSNGNDVHVFDMVTGIDASLQDGRGYVRALAWSPSGDGIAVLDDYGLDIVDASTGTSLPLQAGMPDWTVLDWTASGRIVAASSRELYLVDPPGWFCARAVQLAGGTNRFVARATDAAGNHGLRSAPIEVVVPTGELPDLEVGAADIFVMPPTGAVGQDFAALVTLRNNGTTTVEHPELAVTLVAPDGRRTALDAPPPTPLGSGQAEAITYPIGVLSFAGRYRIDVVADPAQRVRESDEDNNAASTTLTVGTSGAPELELDLAQVVFAPGEAVTGEVGVVATGSTFEGHVRLDVQDNQGALVMNLGDLPLGGVAFGQRWSAPVTWTAQGVLAGDYRVRAQLFDDADTLVDEQSVAFSIEALRHIQLTLTSDAPVETQGQAVVIHSALTFVDGNALVEGATVRLTALDVAGSEVWRSEQAIGTLLPGYDMARDDAWPTAGLAEGVYTLRLSLLSPDYAASVDASVTLVAAAPAAAMSGSLVFEPGTSVVAGQGALLRARIVNRGSVDLSGMQARVRIVAEPGQTPVGEWTDAFDLAAGQTHETTMTLDAPPLALVAHAAILEARLPADAIGQWRMVARQGFAVVDALPPTIEVSTPPADSTQPAVVPFAARILDRHSGVAKVEIRIDAGTWQPVSADADGTYSRGISGLIDGAHALSVRARDAWSNETQTAPLPFTVDASPPTIAIDGVSDGDMLNHAVVPVVTIADSHLASSEIRLDGVPFVSGTSVGDERSHVLIARASDEAGNASVRSVRFTIDRTAPLVTIAAPVDGAVFAQPEVDVDALTEPFASVALASGTYQASAVADAQGHALFAVVPLLAGSNAISASARDAAGNVGGPATIHVEYQPEAIGSLIGSLQPPGPELPWGVPLGVHVDVRNPNAVALVAQHLRVRVLDPALAVLSERALDHDFGAHEDFATDLVFASDGWPLDELTLRLEVQQPNGWLALDTRTIDLVDRAPPLLALAEPREGAVLRSPVALRATAGDPLSGIAAVEASIDGGDWSLLVEVGSGEYESAPLAEGDGEHEVVARARDGAGNLAIVGPVHFSIDTFAPLINIAGVGDGDLLAHPVTPVISIADPHLLVSDVRLNGQPFVSGTPVAASGNYRIDVLANDSANNEASMSLRFTLDLDAPTVTFTEPSQGAVTTAPRVDVIGQTEALASVHLVTGTFSVDATADADGRFEVPGVPLQAGENTLIAHATDRAGNVGPASQVVVIYEAPQASVTGHILALATPWPHGSPFPAPYAVQNTGAVALSGLPLQFEIRSAAGSDVLLEDSFAVDLPIGAQAEGSRMLSIEALPAGDYTIALSANLPTSGWAVLDIAQLTLVGSSCGNIDAIFVDGFDGIGVAGNGAIFCDGFESHPMAATFVVGRSDLWGATTAWLTAVAKPPERASRILRPFMVAAPPRRAPAIPDGPSIAPASIVVPSIWRERSGSVDRERLLVRLDAGARAPQRLRGGWH